jgi:hypothetical protein
MTANKLFAAALGGLALVALPLATAGAQSGDALAKAETTCKQSGVSPASAGYDFCVGRVAFALDRGDKDLATREARVIVTARNVCSSYGIDKQSLQYRQCIANELDRRVPGGGAPVAAAGYGFSFDSQGNLLDRNGNVIRPYGSSFGSGSIAQAR